MRSANHSDSDRSTEVLRKVQTPATLAVYYRVRGLDLSSALNQHSIPPSDSEHSSNIAEDLKLAVNHLKSEGWDMASGRLNYGYLRHSPTFAKYTSIASQLRTFDLSKLKDGPERKAFWINVYNALIIHAVMVFDIQTSVKEHPGFFDRAAYVINGMRFSANDIEHGILRANAGHPAIPGPQFAACDPRTQYCEPTVDPRIHFALVCAARSCPPIGVYSAELLDAQLDLATRHFVNDGGTIVLPEVKTVALSRIFSWYASDFGAHWFGYRKQHMLLEYVCHYLENDEAVRFVQANLRQLKVRFLAYDWNLNV